MKKKNLIISAIMLILAVALFVTSVFAWFSISRTPNTSLGIQVVPEINDIYKDIMKISLVDDGLEESKDNYLSPGKANIYKIEIKNNTSADLALSFNRVEVTQASFSTARNYKSYVCDLYEKNQDESLTAYSPDISDDNAAQILKAMSEPVTNALSFVCGSEEDINNFLGGHGGYDKSMLTAFGDDSVGSTDAAYMEFSGQDKKIVWVNRGILTANGERVVIPQGAESTVYFAIYFDGKTYTDGVFDEKSLVMKNSNGYLWQQVKISLALSAL